MSDILRLADNLSKVVAKFQKEEGSTCRQVLRHQLHCGHGGREKGTSLFRLSRKGAAQDIS